MKNLLKKIIISIGITIFLLTTISAKNTSLAKNSNSVKKSKKSTSKKKEDSLSKALKKISKTPSDKSKTDPVDKKSKKSTLSKKNKEKKKKEIKKVDEKQKVKWIEETIAFGIQNDRKDAINRILLIKDKSYKKKLIKLLIEVIKNEIDSETKIKAITVVGELEAQEAGIVLLDSLDDDSQDVKIAAVYALDKLKVMSSKPKLIELLKKQDMGEDSNLTQSLINVLGNFKSKEALDYIEKSIDETKTTKANRELLVLFLGKVKSDKSIKLLIKLYTDEDEEKIIRSYAVNSLAKLKEKVAIKHIKEVLKTIDSFKFKKKRRHHTLYLYSVAALVNLGDKSAISRLMHSLKSNSAIVRLKAIKLIKTFDDKRTIDILKYKMNYDPNGKVRKAAKKALKELGVDVEEVEKEAKEKKENALKKLGINADKNKKKEKNKKSVKKTDSKKKADKTNDSSKKK